MLFAFALLILLGFGALAIDVGYIRLAQMQTQDIADAASQAAMYRLRRTGDLDDARTAALATVEQNRVVGTEPVLEHVTFGIWDHTFDPPRFTANDTSPNAVRVGVSRTGENGVGLFLARLFGFDFAHITREATSAARSLNVILVMDITGSWHNSASGGASQRDFANARGAAVAFLDTLETSYGEYDQVAMTVFTGRYAWEFTPFTYLQDEASSGTARAAWTAMNIASQGGTPRSYPKVCTLKTGGSGSSAKANVFTGPTGGCYPNMPREYTDETGTDHTTGISLAREMFEENDDPTAFRAMVVLTDGAPNPIGATQGKYRAADGYTETRWREYVGPRPHSVAQIKADSNTLTQEMYDTLGVNTWVVSFRDDNSFMHTMPKGVGYYTLTSDSSALAGIFEDIANSLPMAIVE
ncbi:MAG: TadG family pilus assembly protein [Myxococcota bacterium]